MLITAQDQQLILRHKNRPWSEEYAENLEESVLLEEVESISCSYAFAEEELIAAQIRGQEHDVLPLGIQISITFFEPPRTFLWKQQVISLRTLGESW